MYFSDKFGFTENEVQNILLEYDLLDKKYEIKEWYDGYNFGNSHAMYCPCDVINHVQSLLIDRNSQPKTYWINSSANAIITDIIESENFKIDNKQDKISALCQGQCIEANIEEFFTYENLHSSDDTLWNLLFLTGYLTLSPSSNTDAKDGHEWGRASFLLPNKDLIP